MTTINGTDKVRMCIESGNAANVDVLVVKERPLNFDMLLEIGAITELGGAHITCPGGEVKFKEKAIYGDFHIEDIPDFYIEFNEWRKVWMWRGSGQMIVNPKN